MSREPIAISIDLDCSLSKDVVSQTIHGFRSAVTENWRTSSVSAAPKIYYRGRELSDDDVEEIVKELQCMDSSSEHDWRLGRISAELSPVSIELVELRIRVSVEHKDSLLIWLDVREDTMHEVEGSRELERMEREWMRELERRGKITNADTWPFEHPTEEELGEDGYDAWWKRYFDLRDKTPSVWPQNRQCLLNIVEQLKRALPVKEVHLDPRLLNDLAKADQVARP